MKLTAQLKLRPTPAHADAVRRTLEAANAACDAISRTAWDTQTFRQFALHTLVYYGIRADFGVSSQLTVRCIAKVADAYTKIVAKAEGTTRAISLEDLKGIRTRVTVRRSQRATLQSWAFFQLRAFIVYKAALAGVDVHLVDPRNTSRTCPKCGCIAKANRKTQASFVCTRCGFAGHADVIAAGIISGRAPVNVPYCSESGSPVAPEQSPRL